MEEVSIEVFNAKTERVEKAVPVGAGRYIKDRNDRGPAGRVVPSNRNGGVVKS